MVFAIAAAVLIAFLVMPSWFLTPLAWTVSESESTPGLDLTSHEFQRAFAAAITQALTLHQRAKVVCVLDDLDRLTGAHWEEVVTTLRIFLDTRDMVGADLFRRVWFVVPFDRTAFLAHVSTDSGTSASNDVLAKLFAQRYDVPASTPVEGSTFFRDQFRRAFPSHTNADASAVWYMLEDREGVPTPRRVKEFISAIAVHHRTRCGAIPITDIAAYVLVADELTPRTLVAANRPGGTLDEDAWRSHCAALYFRVAVNDSQHVLYAPDVDLALSNGHGKRLVELERTPGFLGVLEGAIRARTEEFVTTPLHLLKATRAISELVSHETHEPLWTLLLSAARGVQQWPLDIDLSPVAVILQHARDTTGRDDLQRRLLRALSNGRQLQNDESRDAELARWLSNIRAVLDGSREHPPSREAFDVITGSPAFRLEVLHAIRTGALVWPVEPPIVLSDDEALRRVALDVAATPARWNAYREDVTELMRIGSAWDWTSTLDAVKNMMPLASVMQRDAALSNLVEFCLLLEHVAKRTEATGLLDELATNGGALYWLLHMRRGRSTSALVAALLTRDPAVVGNEVVTSVISPGLEAVRDGLLKDLRHPDENPLFLEEVERILIRVGAGDSASERIRALATALDARGGITFRLMYPDEGDTPPP
jgi:hypothetical protein